MLNNFGFQRNLVNKVGQQSSYQDTIQVINMLLWDYVIPFYFHFHLKKIIFHFLFTKANKYSGPIHQRSKPTGSKYLTWWSCHWIKLWESYEYWLWCIFCCSKVSTYSHMKNYYIYYLIISLYNSKYRIFQLFMNSLYDF